MDEVLPNMNNHSKTIVNGRKNLMKLDNKQSQNVTNMKQHKIKEVVWDGEFYKLKGKKPKITEWRKKKSKSKKNKKDKNKYEEAGPSKWHCKMIAKKL